MRTLSIIGLGYVGLPVAIAFSKKYSVVGFDININRISELKEGLDRTKEVSSEDLKFSNILFTSNPLDLSKANFHIVTVPTPVDEHKKPDLTPLIKASETLGPYLKKGDIVVYESTVYPGATEEVCLPILALKSGLTPGLDFKVGYSPERINPGDKNHVFTNILKIVSGQDEECLKIISETYKSVVTAGVYEAQSIKVAEAAKVIENTQRDLNIALINELALIFDRMNIDTQQVLAAAGTKWNFLPFKPGLVGGHCIGVDPYYLTYKAESIGYIPQVILSGRKINDSISAFVVEKTIKFMIQQDLKIKGARIAILGLTFKENCPDLRNSKVKDIIELFMEYGLELFIHDPQAHSEELVKEFGINGTSLEKISDMDALVVCVPHKEYSALLPREILKLLNPRGILMDVKGIWSKEVFLESDIKYWRL